GLGGPSNTVPHSPQVSAVERTSDEGRRLTTCARGLIRAGQTCRVEVSWDLCDFIHVLDERAKPFRGRVAIDLYAVLDVFGHCRVAREVATHAHPDMAQRD